MRALCSSPVSRVLCEPHQWLSNMPQGIRCVRIRKDGSSVLLAITVSPIKAADGTIVGASKIAHDITEQTLIQQNLEDSELRFRALADNIPQLTWIAMPDGNPFWFNHRWVELTGVDFNTIDREERGRRCGPQQHHRGSAWPIIGRCPSSAPRLAHPRTHFAPTRCQALFEHVRL